MERKWEAKLKQIEERASHYEREPLSLVYKPRLSKPEEPPSIWKLFHRQTEAFNFVKSCKEDVHIFALEYKVGDGQRIYLVTTYVQLWFYYKSRRNLLHCYEVIPENAVCKLYFDLEFNRLANPGADGKKMVALLIEHVCKALQQFYRVSCSAEDVLNLDSSTNEKFSRHLIFQLHDVAFKDNIHVGNFVRKILEPAFHLIASEDDDMTPETMGHEFSHFSETPIKQGISFSKKSTDKDIGESWTTNSKKLERLGSAKQSSPDLSFLIVKNNIGEKHLFVDLGVYTRNRNFRLYKSSKIGKYVPLEVAEDNKFYPVQLKTISKENQYFLSALVSNVRFSDTLRILTCDISQNKQKRVEYFNHTSTSVETIEGFQCSPYPEIDQFVLLLVNKNGIKGGIRRWSYFFPEELLVYDICKYRWCENIGRAHKSNNIMILVDLKNEVWYQKCHDPICKAENFKSDCFPLPAEVRLLFLLKEEEEFTADETRNPHEPSSSASSKGTLSDADWDNGIDDAYILEATEDAELAEAAEDSLLSYNGIDEIPDELIIEVLEEY
ncbi:DNA-directed primase/polymerase protein isoform X1 [Physeter macrocephalus]|uniref:DNA-directed primase/polymerase protein n=1 Tax=Physeter macrocephalus TaxID=9755 RepID=A0A2Y9EHH3_PHYMC|nr:DNA-directed primase/polymerase protein isoform X1 [Physeter catodon]XP_007102901.2 DNA-directed primase/polymerase protein isoform X1 [Physeter catodon]XP_007102903.2 DNA-directed primase/polymerase protein isoform X1 [Physeter catodon]XP_007102904.2 DNA-directed primase/polymerase protein isoform X1 [Physeter catodon]XP_007102905.2 DNA-directed primase/polymerase protein isoform X1 [Physeter catodon]XP_023973120.1 DNA-directed primase/polymerase protein isoform X1 [Physeter catodon]XP_02|eukprot:XP_007102900.2 DNA-directed primase/polymerase protein isoform X1 [Physeter catodon]